MTRAVVNDSGTIRVDDLDTLPGATAAKEPVEVELLAADVMPKDRQTASGRIRIPLPPYFVHGSQAVARRVDTGETVFVRASMDAGGGLRDGVFAERFVAEERWLIPMPPGLDARVAAAGTAAVADALYALDDLAGLRRAETVLVLGSSTGVGAAAIDVALSRGCRVIAATRDVGSVAPRDGLTVLAYDGLPEAVRAATDGKGADVVVDNVGGDITQLGLRSLGWRGRQILLGYLAGMDVPLRTADLIVNEVRLVGMNSGAVPAERQVALVTQALQILADGTHAPQVSAVRPLSEGADALTGDAPSGRTVLVP